VGASEGGELLDKVGLGMLKGLVTKAYLMKANDRVVVEVPNENLGKVIEELRRSFGKDGFYVSTVVGTDLIDQKLMRVDYFIYIAKLKRFLVLRLFTDRENPKVTSLYSLGLESAIPGECEAHDLLGIKFEGNPFLKRPFFAPEEFVKQGIYPLRKDVKV